MNLAAKSGVEYRLGHNLGSLQVDRLDYQALPESKGVIPGNLIDAAGFTKLAQHHDICKNLMMDSVVRHQLRCNSSPVRFLYCGKADFRVLDEVIKVWKTSG